MRLKGHTFKCYHTGINVSTFVFWEYTNIQSIEMILRIFKDEEEAD